MLKKSDQITLDQNGQCLAIDDDLIDMLDAFHTNRLVPKEDDHHGYDVKPEAVSLLRDSFGGRIANAGLFDALAWRAQQLGMQSQQRLTLPVSQLSPPSCSGALRSPQLVDFVQANELGLIRRPQGIKVETIIRDLATAFPDAKITAVGTHYRELRRICKQLRDSGIKAVAVSTRKNLGIRDDDEDDQLVQVLLSTPCEMADWPVATRAWWSSMPSQLARIASGRRLG